MALERAKSTEVWLERLRLGHVSSVIPYFLTVTLNMVLNF